VASLEQTMHEAAVRALSQQEAALEALRARTGTVLTAASVIASLSAVCPVRGAWVDRRNRVAGRSARVSSAQWKPTETLQRLRLIFVCL
jgi:hypothetical protein